jgi:cytochrome c peroxidase
LALMNAPLDAQEVTTTEDGYVPSGMTASVPAAPLANTVTEAETVLPPSTPDYFQKAYKLYMKAPLPARIYDQGGFPAVIPQLEIDRNALGRNGTYLPDHPYGLVTKDNAFFQSLGTNGRSCATCHQPPSGMSISVRNVQARFKATKGTDPIFAPIDGANCPNAVPAANTSGSLYGGHKGKGKKALKDAYSLLLNKGLIRVFFPVRPDFEFDISIVSDKPACNSDPDFGLAAGFVSAYRRPPMSAQLDFKTHRPNGTGPISALSVMWDGREPSLESQAIDATLGHAQADHPPTEEEIAEIVEFENNVFTAQILDKQAKWLNEPGATGGPVAISEKTPLDLAGLFTGGPPPFTPFKEYDAWAANSNAKRASIKRGQDIFNTRTFIVSNVAGINDVSIAPGVPPNNAFPTQCSTCHNQTAGGADVLPASLRDIGVGGQSVAFGGQPVTYDLPVLKLTCKDGKQPHAFSGPVVITNDPGRALISGKCTDIGQRTVPPLRALASRAPYFSNGSAKDLMAVVNFYNTRFNIGLTEPEKTDLANFMGAL